MQWVLLGSGKFSGLTVSVSPSVNGVVGRLRRDTARGTHRPGAVLPRVEGLQALDPGAQGTHPADLTVLVYKIRQVYCIRGLGLLKPPRKPLTNILWGSLVRNTCWGPQAPPRNPSREAPAS